MPTADQVYRVVTEFRFDVGHAVASSETLQGAVGNLSQAADEALFSFQRLSLGLITSMGLGSGSLLGILGSAIKSSDKFSQSQRDFTNIIMSNIKGAFTFQDVMEHTEGIMDSINKKANEFSLPAGELLSMSKAIGAILLNKGLDDPSMKKSIDLSRQFLKSAPTLGIHPGEAQGQLTRAIMGGASMGDTLFLRMAAETSAMNPFSKGGGAQAFNALAPEKRLNLLTKALAQFSSNVDVLRGNAMSLTGELRRMQEALTGTFSIFRKIGDSILDSLLPVLHNANNYIRREGQQIADSLAGIIKNMLTSPEKTLVNLMQMRKAKEDLGQAGSIMGFATVMHGVGWVLSKLTGVAKLAHPAVGWVSLAVGTIATVAKEANPYLGKFLMGLTGIVAVIAVAIKFPVVLGVIGVALTKILLPLLALWGVLQLFSRAAAIAQVDDAKKIALLMPRFTEVLGKLQRAFQPLIDGFMTIFDGVADFLSPIFRVSFYFEGLISVMEWIADTTAKVIAGFQGLTFAILQLFTNLWNKVAEFVPGMSEIGPSGSVAEAFNSGVDDILTKYFDRSNEGKGISGQTVNINKVEIKNNFKENLQPDRIAFSLKEQLLKVSQNPTQARGRSFSTSQSGAF
jgi:hypothetical protein